MHNLTGVNLSRFLGPIAARFMIDFGGRNAYATVQFMVCLGPERSSILYNKEGISMNFY